MEGLDRRQTAIMLAQFKKSVSAPNEFVKFALKSDTEVNIWYIMISGFEGNESEYMFDSGEEKKYGEYLCCMEAPKNFPFEPPHFYMYTRNGVYDVYEKVCISIGEFHKDQYRAALGMSGFAEQLVSGLIGWRDLGGGIRITTTTVAEKKKFAEKSRKYNMKYHADIVQKINDSYADYSAKWDLSKIPEPMKEKLGLQEHREQN